MKQKIHARLILISLIAVLLSAISVTFVYYNLFQYQVRNDLKVDAQLLNDTKIFQESYSDDLSTVNLDQFEQLKSDKLRVTWVDADGTVLYDNDTSASSLGNHLDRPEIQEALEYGEGESIRHSETFNMNTFYYAIRLDNGTVVRVSKEARNMISVFLSVVPIICLIVFIILVICFLLSNLLTRQLLEPLDDMAEHMEDVTYPLVYKEFQPFANKIREQHENILASSLSKQDFTANVSHELKTPLTAITGYAELIENKMVDETQTVSFARQIRKKAERLLSLINDIIQLSELDHELPRQFETLDLYPIVEDSVQSLKENARLKNIDLSFYGEHIKAYVDKNLISELVVNLGQNAIRYNNPGGSVEVYVKTQLGKPCIIIRDDGIGIPKEAQDRVFERFYRVDKSRSKETGGTGLGLAIVKHIAEIHNAKIKLDSEVGKGTTITIIF